MSLVYSTDKGRLCPQCLRTQTECICKKQTASSVKSGDGIVRIQRQTQGRGGKTVCVITGVPLPEAGLKDLAKQLKQQCGCGGSVKDGTIEIQGDFRDKLKAALEKAGFKVKLAGG
jgi:translation initiation factor 1